MPRSSGRLESPIWNQFKKGWRTNGDPTKIERNESPDLQNVVVTPEGSIVVRNGAVVLMDETASSPAKPIQMLKHFKRSDGTSEVLVAYDGKIQNLDMTTGAVSELATTVSGQSTTGSYGADIYNDKIYMCNGVDNMIEYDGSTVTTLTLTNLGASNFTTNTFGFKDRKMYAVDFGDKTLLHRSKTDGGGASDIYTFNYASGSEVENSGTTRIKEGGTPLTAIEVLDQLYIFSENNIFTGDFQDLGTDVIFKIQNVARGVGSVNEGSTTPVGNAIVFYDPEDQSVQQLGQRANYPGVYVSGMSDAIRNITNDIYDFTSAVAVYWKRKWLVACKSDENQSANDTVLVFDLESKGIFPISGWYVSTWMKYGDNLYYGSSTSAQVFQAFTEDADDNSPITWYYNTNIETFGKPETYKDARYLYVEGTIDEGVDIKVDMKFDYGRDTMTKVISGASTEYIIDTNLAGYLGESELGTYRLGGIATESDRVFQVWVRINNKKFQNAQITFSSDNTTSEVGRASIRQFNFVNLREVSIQPPDNRVI